MRSITSESTIVIMIEAPGERIGDAAIAVPRLFAGYGDNPVPQLAHRIAIILPVAEQAGYKRHGRLVLQGIGPFSAE